MGEGLTKAKQPIKTFRDLRVYQMARKQNREVFEITQKPPFSKDYSLANQARRASASVMANIAEGFERGNNKEFIMFLYIAKGSCGEVGAHLDAAVDQKYIDSDPYKNLSGQALHLAALINNFIIYLKGSKIKGLKHKPLPPGDGSEARNSEL